MMMALKDITTQNPEHAPTKSKNCEEKGLFKVKQILKIVAGQHPGVQQFLQRKENKAKEFHIWSNQIVLEMD